MKFEPNSKIRTIPFVKPLRETSFPRFSGRGEQLQIRVLGNFISARSLNSVTLTKGSDDVRKISTFSQNFEIFVFPEIRKSRI